MAQGGRTRHFLLETSQFCRADLQTNLAGLESTVQSLEQDDHDALSATLDDRAGIAPSPDLGDGALDNCGNACDVATIEVDLDDERFDIVGDEIRLKRGEGNPFKDAFWIFVLATAFAPDGSSHAELIALSAFDLEWLSQDGEIFEDDAIQSHEESAATRATSREIILRPDRARHFVPLERAAEDIHVQTRSPMAGCEEHVGGLAGTETRAAPR